MSGGDSRATGAFAPSVPNTTRATAPLTSADGRTASRFYASFHLSFDALRWVPWAFFWRHSFAHRCRCSGPAQLLCLCVVLPPQRLVVHFGTPSRSRGTIGSAMLVLQTVIVVGAARGHAPVAVGTKLFVTAAKWMRYEPSSSAVFERMPLSCARHLASSVLADCPALMVKMTISRARSLTSLVCSLAPAEVAGRVLVSAEEDPARERRRQSASACTCGDMVV